MTHPRIDPADIRVLPLADRKSFIDITRAAADPDAPPPPAGPLAAGIDQLADDMRDARHRGASVMCVYGAHLIKNGCAPLINRLVEHGWITHLATQGAGIIHDLEFAYQGASSESVRDNAPVGRFGTWDETGRFINLAATVGSIHNMGFGQSVGAMMCAGGLVLPTRDELRFAVAEDPDDALTAARADLLSMINAFDLPKYIEFPSPFGQYSITQQAYEQGVPLTVHPGVGYDIFACHPMFNLHAGGAIGRASAADFHSFAHAMTNLSNGVYLSVGSAVMSPQVFEKAFSVANNLREGRGEPFIEGHRITVVDIQESGGWDWSRDGEPPMDHPAYYLRWCKSFHRMNGTLSYLQADNRVLLHNLVARLGGS
ncbi:MAG: hypothetical protein GC162_08525 [Planctomycetes bacterium]|nr:hypothetical protein [Planctomycetota bacterium]